MYKRYLQPAIQEALVDTPVIIINGARQTGKSTLCKRIMQETMSNAQYVTFDDLTALAAARTDPVSFVEGLRQQVVLDEVLAGARTLVNDQKVC